MDDFVNYYKLPRQKLSYDGMNGINYFLDYYMRKYPTKTYVDWARTDVKINPYNKEFYVPDIDGDIRRCEAVRNQMYYDLRDIKDQGISLNPAYIKQLQEQAEQLNDIYQDLINRRATIGFLNGRPISRELYEAPVRFSNFLKQYGK